MEPESSSPGNKLAETIGKVGGGSLKVVGYALLAYIVVMAGYALYRYSDIKQKLLTYGVSDATGSLIAWFVMLIAIGLPFAALARIIFLRGRTYDYGIAMFMPLVSWGIAQIPANFDAKSGEALKFCASRPDDTLFCLDHAGIDPLTQKKLVAINQNVAEIEFRKGKGLVPKRITQATGDVVFFDPLTGEPKVWLSKSDQEGCFDLFDNPGVNPQTGERLQPANSDTVRSVRECAKKAAAETARLDALAKQEAETRRIAQEEKAKKEIEQRKFGDKQVTATHAEAEASEFAAAVREHGPCPSVKLKHHFGLSLRGSIPTAFVRSAFGRASIRPTSRTPRRCLTSCDPRVGQAVENGG